MDYGPIALLFGTWDELNANAFVKITSLGMKFLEAIITEPLECGCTLFVSTRAA